MRDFQQPGRSPVYALNGMAATSHPAATLCAIDMLRSGGNAIDAAVAAGAVLSVVEPQSTGIGGDCFVLYAPGGGGEVIGYNGSGRAPAATNVEWFLDRGLDAVPADGPHAVTVPGAVDAWARLVAAHGRKGLDDVFDRFVSLERPGECPAAAAGRQEVVELSVEPKLHARLRWAVGHRRSQRLHGPRPAYDRRRRDFSPVGAQPTLTDPPTRV